MGPHPAVAAIRLAVRRVLHDILSELNDRPADPPPDPPLVLVACSGGADSVALASALAFEAPRLGLRAGGVTIDHGLQPGSAARAREVAERLTDLGLDPVEAATVSVGRAGGPEAAARTARYAALDAAADRHGAAAVLLGHTRDDQAETVLLGLARGSGTRSLAGMPVSFPGITPPSGAGNPATPPSASLPGTGPEASPPAPASATAGPGGAAVPAAPAGAGAAVTSEGAVPPGGSPSAAAAEAALPGGSSGTTADSPGAGAGYAIPVGASVRVPVPGEPSTAGRQNAAASAGSGEGPGQTPGGPGAGARVTSAPAGAPANAPAVGGRAAGAPPGSSRRFAPRRPHRYWRPFLGVDRQTTRKACLVQALPVWDDPHNADPSYTRSRVRHEALPVLEKALGRGVVEALARTAWLSRDDADALDDWARHALRAATRTDGGLDVAALHELPPAVRRRVLRLAAIAAGAPAGSLFARHIEETDRLITAWRGQRPLNLPGRVEARRQGGRLVLQRASQ